MAVRWPFSGRGARPRVDFQRPDGWHHLDGRQPPAPPQPTSPPQPPAPPAGWPPQPPPPRQSPLHRPGRRPQRKARGTLRLWAPVITVTILSIIVLVGGWNVISWLGDRDPGRTPSGQLPTDPTDPYSPPPRPTGDVPTVWSLDLVDLRPDLGEGRFETSLSGFMDSTLAIDAGDTWAVVTREEQGGSTRLHGLDAATGKERWRRPMDGVFCADDLLGGQLLCAEPFERERGLGTNWTLHRIDPATGATASSADFDGWITGLVVDHGHVLVLEQRLPAPHALITGLDGDLTQAWQIDLSQEEGHADLFSDNRIIIRPEEYPEGPALDRPRVRRVADGLTALWIGARTAFIDVPSGQLVGMPHCSRLVDDGNRLWCNAGSSAVAYDYRLQPITRTEAGVRLAFPYRDPRAGDITVPAFLDQDGALLRVNATTGATEGPLVRTAMGSAFGMAIPPTAATIDGVLVVADDTKTAAVAPDGDILWVSEYGFRLHEPFLQRGNLLSADFYTHELDLATGEILGSWRIGSHGFAVVAVGEQLATYSPDQLARLDLD
nr:PQQ-binding-like beta-propeller repeat protein [Tessaracoccus sp. MC1865]